MAPNAQVTSVVTGSVALFLTALDTVPAINSVAHRILRRSPQQDESGLAKTVYRDEDGEATDESLRSFSDKWQRVALALFSACGLFVTLATAVLTTVNHHANYTFLTWLQFGIWVCRAKRVNGDHGLIWVSY